jgi:hypothetical protein
MFKFSKKLCIFSSLAVTLIVTSCAAPTIINKMEVKDYPIQTDLHTLITGDDTSGTDFVADAYKKSPSDATLFSALKTNVSSLEENPTLYVNDLLLGTEEYTGSMYRRLITTKTNSLLYVPLTNDGGAHQSDIYVYYNYTQLKSITEDIAIDDLTTVDGVANVYSFPAAPDFKEVMKRILKVTGDNGSDDYVNNNTYINQLMSIDGDGTVVHNDGDTGSG